MNQHMRLEGGPIPFIDVAAQRRRLGCKIDDAVARVLAHCQFIQGPEVRALEADLAAAQQQTAATVPLSFQTNLSTSVPGTVTNTVAINPNYQVPYAMIWNAGIEYNLWHNTFLEVMYTGTRGVHLDELLGFTLPGATANAILSDNQTRIIQDPEVRVT